MIELLRAAATREPTRAAVITNDRATTYYELAAAAESAAASLARRGIARFGVVEQDAARVIALLAGASLAGAEACVYPPIEAPGAAAELADRFDHELIVSEPDGLARDGVAVISPGTLIEPATIAPGPGVRRAGVPGPGVPGPGVPGPGVPGPGVPAEPPGDRPLLVLTTGTTGTPRGARHQWGRVIRSATHIEPAPDHRWLLAYGVHQFAGLQIMVHVLAAQATLVAPTPRRPREGLAAMRAHDVDHASATPTFWRFLLAELRSDGGPVPALAQITIGGEAVPDHLLTALKAAFPAVRLSQIYAANEFGPLRSVRDGRSGLPLSLLDRDEEPEIALRVVDGELWVRSRIGMLGYYGEPPLDPDAWRPTGDLVDLDGDRALFRGRSSDIINVGGVKVHPLPIEERIGNVPGVELVRVYGRPNPVTGSIVAAEIVAAQGTDTGELDATVRKACADLLAAARPRSIRFVDMVLTTGHKISRAAADGR